MDKSDDVTGVLSIKDLGYWQESKYVLCSKSIPGFFNLGPLPILKYTAAKEKLCLYSVQSTLITKEDY